MKNSCVFFYVPPVVNTPFSEMTSGGSALSNEYLKIKKFQGKIKKEKTFFDYRAIDSPEVKRWSQGMSIDASWSRDANTFSIGTLSRRGQRDQTLWRSVDWKGKCGSKRKGLQVVLCYHVLGLRLWREFF